MAEPFKNLIHPDLVRDSGAHLARAAAAIGHAAFDRAGFEARALCGLEALELKARAMQVCDALQATLPRDFGQAAALIEASLRPVPPWPEDEEPPATPTSAEGLGGWIVWSLGEYVAREGQAQPQRALACLHALTQRLTAEWAIRPFVLKHPDLVWRTLAAWTRDPSPHVRRLVSEGTRPLLPWGLQLKPLREDPSPTLPLLAALRDDVSPYVRRSVANHLNDIAKDHPDLVVHIVQDWSRDAPPAREKLLRHASRTLIRRGHEGMLDVWGHADELQGQARLVLSPRRVRIGEKVALELTLRSRARDAQALVVDYALHHARRGRPGSVKVFKGWKLELAPGETRTLQRWHSMREVTTRRLEPGRHRIEVRVNGRTVAHGSFELLAG